MKKHAHLPLLLLLAATPAFADTGFPLGWDGGSNLRDKEHYEFGNAQTEGANGEAAYIRAKPGAATNDYFTMTQCIDAKPHAGIRLRLSGRMKTIDASAGQFWMRVDQNRMPMNFDNMNDRRLTGTNSWQTKQIVLNVPIQATRICYGFMLQGGEGEVWADDLKLEQVNFTVPLTSSLSGAFAGHGGMNRIGDR